MNDYLSKDLAQDLTEADLAIQEPWSASCSVLLVDPDEGTRARLVAGLQDHCPQLEIVAVCSGSEALAQMDEREFDCAVVEYALPDQDGVALLGMLRCRSDLSLLPTILMTDAGSERLAVEALKAGAVDYFQKAALDADTLLRAIRHGVERQHLHRALDQSRSDAAHRILELERRHAAYQKEREEMACTLLSPLAAATEFVALVFDGVAGPITEQQGKYLAYARGSCNELKKRLQELVVTTHLDAVKVAEPDAADLKQLLDEVIDSLTLEARFKMVRISSVVAPDLASVRVDQFQLKQVLAQLVRAALNVTADAGAILVAASRSRAQKHEIEISITTNALLDTMSGNQRVAHYKRLFSMGAAHNEYLVDTNLSDGLRFSFNIPTNAGCA